jgi:hypothetical protein
MTLDEIIEDFDSYIDGIYEPFVLDELVIPASIILKEYPKHYDDKISNYMQDRNVVVSTDSDGDDCYTYNFYDENEE